MFKVTVESVTKPIAVRFCPFCGSNRLQKVSFGGESEDNPTSEGIVCENCSLFFVVGDVDAESFQHLNYVNENGILRPFTTQEREQEFLSSFINGIWDDKGGAD